MRSRKIVSKPPAKPAKQQAISFYGSSAPRPSMVPDADKVYSKTADLPNAPLLDWASKANIKAGGGMFSPKPAAAGAARPLGAFAQLVQEQRHDLRKDPELRALYRDVMPAKVIMAEAVKRARKVWKSMAEEERNKLEQQAKDAQAEHKAAVNNGKGAKRTSDSKKNKVQRARSPFQIYVAEAHASLLADKPVGLKGYRAFVEGQKSKWAALTAEQQQPFVDKAKGEKEDSKAAKAAMQPKKKARASSKASKGKAKSSGKAKEQEVDDDEDDGFHDDSDMDSDLNEEEQQILAAAEANGESDEEELTEEDMLAADTQALATAVGKGKATKAAATKRGSAAAHMAAGPSARAAATAADRCVAAGAEATVAAGSGRRRGKPAGLPTYTAAGKGLAQQGTIDTKRGSRKDSAEDVPAQTKKALGKGSAKEVPAETKRPRGKGTTEELPAEENSLGNLRATQGPSAKPKALASRAAATSDKGEAATAEQPDAGEQGQLAGLRQKVQVAAKPTRKGTQQRSQKAQGKHHNAGRAEATAAMPYTDEYAPPAASPNKSGKRQKRPTDNSEQVAKRTSKRLRT